MNQSTEEIWKDVPGYEGLYQVSNIGNVYSLGRIALGKNGAYYPKKPKHMKPTLNKGYLKLDLRNKEGERRIESVHRLVALAFIPNPNHYPEVNHINEIKTDNRVENLEWCTTAYNVNWGTRNDRVAQKLQRPIIGINIKTHKEIYFNSIADAKRNGFFPACILRGKGKSCNGFYWRYADDDNFIIPTNVFGCKRIKAISIIDGTEIVFDSIIEASRHGHVRDLIRDTLNKKRKHYHNYYWEYIK